MSASSLSLSRSGPPVVAQLQFLVVEEPLDQQVLSSSVVAGSEARPLTTTLATARLGSLGKKVARPLRRGSGCCPRASTATSTPTQRVTPGGGPR